MSETALTRLAQAGGCAAKYSAARLETLLAGVATPASDDLLVGLDPADDAAVYRLDDERALVFTVDFFPPVVDDPHDFGVIAATNALNDVYAMGGTPLLALSVTAFPEELPVEVLGDVLAGAREAVEAAGAILAGGHTIRDDEPKYGLAVVGTVHPQGVWEKSGARVGDAVLLTKPLGTGLVLQAQRERRAEPEWLEAAVEGMKTSNRVPAETLRPYRPGAVTDVTGFGLAGHSHETAQRSGVRIVLEVASLPALPGALELAAAGVRTGGDRRNREFAGPHVTSSVDETEEALAYDPQTAGGLLVTLPAERAVSSRLRSLPWDSSYGGSDGSRRGAAWHSSERLYTRSVRGVWARLRTRPVPPGRFVKWSVISLGALFVVVTSGAFVRLTASGLGCDNWPRCGDRPFPETGYHAFVEFGNRMVALVGIVLTLVVWLASRRVAGLPRRARWLALAAFLGTVAQIPLGGITVILDLHPVAVMSHFLLALGVVALAVLVALEAWSHHRGVGDPVGPRWLRLVVAGCVAACLCDGRHRSGRHGLRASLRGRGRPTVWGWRSPTPCTCTSAPPPSTGPECSWPAGCSSVAAVPRPA